jgi:hypothetical protein
VWLLSLLWVSGVRRGVAAFFALGEQAGLLSKSKKYPESKPKFLRNETWTENAKKMKEKPID